MVYDTTLEELQPKVWRFLEQEAARDSGVKDSDAVCAEQEKSHEAKQEYRQNKL